MSRHRRHIHQHHWHNVGRCLRVNIIYVLVLGLYNIRHSKSFTISRGDHRIKFHSHNNGIHHQNKSPLYGVTVLGSDIAVATTISLPSDVLTERDNFPRMKAESIMDINVNINIASSRNFTFVGGDRVVVAGWMERFRQLCDFKNLHGHTLVPKRYKNNPSLGNWVSKQRQLYHNYQTGKKPCSLTKERIGLLEQLNFCWNATTSIRRHDGDVIEQDTALDEEWWSRYDELYENCQTHDGIHSIIRQNRLGIWLDHQRKIYDIQKTSTLATTKNVTTICHLVKPQYLTEDQLEALSRISDVWWMTRRQWQWELRYRELQQFTSQYGHCCVPISYSTNKHLAHWVSNQRKLYNLRKAGKRSELIPSRIQKLDDIGFVWNLWDYEFSKKLNPMNYIESS